MKTLAVIAARGGSKRLPGKNVRPFLGKPLIHWSLQFALAASLFDRVVVSTDSDEIALCCEQMGVGVPHRRAPHLASDTATSVDVALDELRRVESAGEHFDCIALLQPTSPLRIKSRWIEALRLLGDHACDAAIGVSTARNHPFQVFRPLPDGRLEPWCDADRVATRSQDLPTALVVNGSLYLVRAATLEQHKTFFPVATKGVLCDEPCESIDLDTEADWIAAEALAAKYWRTV